MIFKFIYIMTLSNITLMGSAIFTGLMAGLFYSYSCSVVPGLHKLPDEQYIAAMQSINRSIQNPVFFISFFGALILPPVATYLNYSGNPSASYWFLLAATILYLGGSFGVTAFGNIPLNNALESFNLSAASKEAISLQRLSFEPRWNALNIIRTVSAILSFILILVACFTFSFSRSLVAD
jgi:uncharacterized membrane protein